MFVFRGTRDAKGTPPAADRPSVKGLRPTTATAPFVQFDRTMVEDQIFYRTRMIDPEVMFFYRMM